MFKSAYPNLDREMEEKRYSLKKLVEGSSLKYVAVCKRLKEGRASLDDAYELKRLLESEQTIDDLFLKVGWYD